ncbi:MAG TPA: NUDIX domain-containing protein [Ktedonobacterales bacterium]|nr:NUDIX domain-containing protein [Ktedonobacterales bacterium]
MPLLSEKVVAYITHRRRLLVFTHRDHPEAGVQVPAGTVEPGESGEVAVLREAREETGLRELTLVRYLGEQWRDLTEYRRDKVLHRRFYHLRCLGQPPETWQSAEEHSTEGDPKPIVFDCFWVPLPDGVPELAAEQGHMLLALLADLAATD